MDESRAAHVRIMASQLESLVRGRRVGRSGGYRGDSVVNFMAWPVG